MYVCILLCILQIVTEELDFRLYKKLSHLEEALEEDLFPPRFNVKLNCPNPLVANTLNLDYKIHLKSHRKMDRDLSLNIFIPGNTSNQPKHITIPVDSSTGMYIFLVYIIYKNFFFPYFF